MRQTPNIIHYYDVYVKEFPNTIDCISEKEYMNIVFMNFIDVT